MALDWFEARAKCKNATFEGDLLTLDSEQVNKISLIHINTSVEFKILRAANNTTILNLYFTNVIVMSGLF